MDMTMYETVKEFKNSVDLMMGYLKREAGDNLLEMSSNDLEGIKMVFTLVDVSMKLVCKQAETIQEMNDKLDKLMATKKD